MILKLQILRFVPILLMGLSILSCSSSDATRDSPQRMATYGGAKLFPVQSDTSIVLVGDSIAIIVWDATQFNTHATVKPNGAVTIPFIGEMKVAGYAKEELLKILRRKLSEYIKGDVFFSLEVTKPPLKISVFGMVLRQGSFPANNELSLVDALIMAGGWGESADLRYIRITHQSTFGAEVGSVEFDLTPFLETGDSRGMPVVRPGDVIIVPKKENYILEFSGFVGSFFLLFGFFGLLR
jgi:polysaccharide export outer membrane protein